MPLFTSVQLQTNSSIFGLGSGKFARSQDSIVRRMSNFWLRVSCPSPNLPTSNSAGNSTLCKQLSSVSCNKRKTLLSLGRDTARPVQRSTRARTDANAPRFKSSANRTCIKKLSIASSLVTALDMHFLRLERNCALICAKVSSLHAEASTTDLSFETVSSFLMSVANWSQGDALLPVR